MLTITDAMHSFWLRILKKIGAILKSTYYILKRQFFLVATCK